jgi:hypothetical protein
MISTARWVPVNELPSPSGKTVLLYQEGDLYPVIGFRIRGIVKTGEPETADFFMLEEGGPEDGEHRKYPFAQNYKPTHWCEVPATPLPLEGTP